MSFQYKHQISNAQLTHKSRVGESIQTQKLDITDEIIFQIQAEFLKILEIQPFQVDQKSLDVFKSLFCILHQEEFLKSLPRIVPFSTYKQLLYFLDKTNDSRIHETISWIIEILTSDYENSILELAKYNIIELISKQMDSFKFPNSIEHLLQIILNIISCPTNGSHPQFAQAFSINFLIAIFQFIKANINISQSYDPKIVNPIICQSLKLIYSSLKKNPSSITQKGGTILIIELNGYFNIFRQNQELNHLMTQIMSLLFDHQLFILEDFINYECPEFFLNLSHSENESIKADALIIIGKMISVGIVSDGVNFLEYFAIIMNSNESTNTDLLSSAFYICKCLFDNSKFAGYAFKFVSENANALFQICDLTSFAVKENVIELFSAYLNHFSKSNAEMEAQFEPILYVNTRKMFDFVSMNDQIEKVGPTLLALHNFNQYLFSYCPKKSEFINRFLTDYKDCLENLVESDDISLKEEADKYLARINCIGTNSN